MIVTYVQAFLHRRLKNTSNFFIHLTVSVRSYLMWSRQQCDNNCMTNYTSETELRQQYNDYWSCTYSLGLSLNVRHSVDIRSQIGIFLLYIQAEVEFCPMIDSNLVPHPIIKCSRSAKNTTEI